MPGCWVVQGDLSSGVTRPIKALLCCSLMHVGSQTGGQGALGEEEPYGSDPRLITCDLLHTHTHTHIKLYAHKHTHTHRRVYYVLMLQRMIYNLRIGRHSYRCWFLRGLMFSQFAIGPTSLLRETGIAALLTPHITHLWIHSPVNVLLVMMLCFQPLFVIEISWEVIIQFVWNMADR